MSQEKIDDTNLDEERPWKRIGKTVIEKHAKQEEEKLAEQGRIPRALEQAFPKTLRAVSNIFLNIVHVASRVARRPVVDIGQTYSVSALNERIVQLEEILVRQWTNYREDDYLTPNDQVQQYLAACHVARQYDRITLEQLSTRLGVSQRKAAMLLDQMMEDEIITESYTVTYHDVRRAAVDAAIEHQLGAIPRNIREEVAKPHSNSSKKH